MGENIEKALKEYEAKNYNEAFKLFQIVLSEMKEEEFNRMYSFKFIKTIFECVIKNLSELTKSSQSWIVYLMKLEFCQVSRHILL